MIMPFYRICRSDDLPTVVIAIDTCWRVHFDDEPPMTIDRFRHEVETLGVSASSTAVAIEAGRPIAVALGTRRGDELSIARIGVHPDHQRQGHGGQLLATLLQQALPSAAARIIVEVPDALAGACAFFQAVADRRDATFTDWARSPSRVRPIPDALVAPIGVHELDAQGLLDGLDGGTAWARRRESLRGRAMELEGVGLVTDRVEAFALFEPAPVRTETLNVVAVHTRETNRQVLLGGALLRWLAGSYPTATIRLLRLAEEELPAPMLERLGFAPMATYGRWTVAAAS